MTELLVNNKIKSDIVRLISENGEQEIISLSDALGKAKDENLDLVQFSSNSPPTVKILNYSKYKFEQKKKQKESQKKSRQQRVEVKELQFRPVTDTNDLNRIIDHANKFLAKGHKVKFVCKFRGRENANKQAGYDLMDYIIDQVDGAIDGNINKQDRNIIAIISK